MKCAVTVKSITRLVEVGMADSIVSEINRIEAENARLKAEVDNFKEYLKWHADGHKFNAWEIWRRQQSDAGEGKPSV